MKTIDQLAVNGKRVFLRVDFNVPLSKETPPTITDDTRIRAAVPTIKSLIDRGARLIVASHLGRPKGERNEKYSLRPIVGRLSELTGVTVKFADDCVGERVENLAKELKNGEILLLENLRFHAEEEQNDPNFSKQLARLADVYVDDAFGAAHRAHASIEGIAQLVPEKAAGYLLEKEVKYLGGVMEHPARPYVAIIGGAKISGKTDVIQELLGRADRVLIGGGMMFTFLKAMGKEIGNSLVEEDKIALARQLLETSGGKLVLPVDTIVADKFDNNAATRTTAVDSIPAGWSGLDIGPKTIERFKEALTEAKTIVWNGPMGVFEMPNFANGTNAIAQLMSEATKRGAITIVGGGDSVAAIEQAGLAERITHVSTGGGASLELLEGKVLPGIAALG